MNTPEQKPEIRINPPLIYGLDVVVVCCLAVIPDFFSSLQYFLLPDFDLRPAGLMMDTFWLIIRSVQVSAPVLLIIHLAGFSWKDFGFKKVRLVIDPLIGIGLVVASYALIAAINIGAYFLGIEVDQTNFASTLQPLDEANFLSLCILILIASLFNGFAEELVMRSYLMTRIRHASIHSSIAVIGTSALFASYHLYQGVYAAMLVFVIGLILGSYFAISRRLFPIVFAHFLMDAIPLFTILLSQDQ